MLVKDLMTKDVVTITPATPIKEIAKIIVKRDISGVPVVNEKNRVIGIVSEGDLVQREMPPELPDGLCILGAVIYYRGLVEYREAFRKLWAARADQIMTKEVITCKAKDDVAKAAKLLSDNHIKRVVVTDEDGILVGIVSRRDIVKMLL